MSNDIARVMAIKASLGQTTGTQGWGYVKQLADNIVTKTTDEALEEEDSTKRDAKVLKAAALKKGFRELFNAIENTKNLDIPNQDVDEDLEALETEHVSEN